MNFITALPPSPPVSANMHRQIHAPQSFPSHHRSHSYTGATAASIRRKRSITQGYDEKRIQQDNPWEHMTQTYTWVVEQEHLRQDKRNRKTEEWVLEQQVYITEQPRHCRSASVRRDIPRRKTWEEVVYKYEVDADRWMRHEEESRRLAEERQRTKARIQEELRRIDERIAQRRREEKRLYAETRAKALESIRGRDRNERAKSEKTIVEAWTNYESRWSDLATTSDVLTFTTVPWPMVLAPKSVEEITPGGIALFLLSSAHSEFVTRKDRIRGAQLRWHPDRFRRLMSRVPENEKTAIEEGVGIIARSLNDMMEREKAASRH